MIRLTRLDNTSVIVNAELIKFVEETPDTILTLRDNERVRVLEKADVVVKKAIEYGMSLRGILSA